MSSFALLWLVGPFGVLESARGQELTPTITSLVVDSTGAGIKDASVTAKDTDRGSISTARTDGSGIFTTMRISGRKRFGVYRGGGL